MSDEINQDEINRLLGLGDGDDDAASNDAGGADEGTPEASSEATPSGDSDLLSQDDLEDLIGSATGGGDSGPIEQAATTAAQSATVNTPGSYDVAKKDFDHLLTQAEQIVDTVGNDAELGELPSSVEEFSFRDFPGAPANENYATLELINDVKLDVKIELGRTYMYLEDVLRLRSGSVVPLDKLAGDPVDIYVNGRLVARGEVLVLSDNFCVRIGELVVGTCTM